MHRVHHGDDKIILCLTHEDLIIKCAVRRYAAGVLNLGIASRVVLSSRFSSSRSKSACKPSQNFAELPKYFEKRKAVSAVILRSPLMIAEILVCGIPVSLDSLYAEIPRGERNSSCKTSPG